VSWCNSLASTPVVGVRYEPLFRPAEEYLAALSPVLSRELDNDRPAFDVEGLEPFKLTLNTESGFRYTVDHSNASVAFNHRIRAKAGNAGPPTMELISRAEPYTQLLDAVTGKLLEAMELLEATRPRRIKRIGIVTLTQVVLEDAPPGIVELFENAAQPFGGNAASFSMNMTTLLGENEKTSERCVYSLTLPEPPETLVTLQLDWQRTFLGTFSGTKSALADALRTGAEDALAHFERVAEGGLNDARS
jgi:hypothetical protein